MPAVEFPHTGDKKVQTVNDIVTVINNALDGMTGELVMVVEMRVEPRVYGGPFDDLGHSSANSVNYYFQFGKLIGCKLRRAEEEGQGWFIPTTCYSTRKTGIDKTMVRVPGSIPIGGYEMIEFAMFTGRNCDHPGHQREIIVGNAAVVDAFNSQSLHYGIAGYRCDSHYKAFWEMALPAGVSDKEMIDWDIDADVRANFCNYLAEAREEHVHKLREWWHGSLNPNEKSHVAIDVLASLLEKASELMIPDDQPVVLKGTGLEVFATSVGELRSRVKS